MRSAVVAEDSSAIRRVLARFLEIDGFEVHECRSGAEALAIISTRSVTLATVDLGLPDTNGAELVTRIFEACPTIEVLVVTGHATSSFVPLVLEAGAFDVIYKPFERATLQESLRRVGLIA